VINHFRALLTDELESVFAKAPEAPNSVTSPRVREAFLRATGQIAESSSAATNIKRRIPGEEDDCPICYDTMYHVAEAALTFCEECGNALHKECFVQCMLPLVLQRNDAYQVRRREKCSSNG